MMKRKIKYLLFSLITVLFVNGLHAQNQEKFFKENVLIDANTPDWVRLMYSKDPNVFEVTKAYEIYYKDHVFVKNTHTQNYKHWKVEIAEYINENGFIRLPSEIEAEKSLQSNTLLRESTNNNSKTAAANWKCIGPFNTKNPDNTLKNFQSNIYSIAPSPSNPDIIYAGSAGGTVFKSIDRGLTWEPVSHKTPIYSVSAVAVHPTNPNIVYVNAGDGVYKTIDGGINWTRVLTKNELTRDIEINHSNPNIILAAASDGLFRTDNAGTTWTKVHNLYCWDIEFHPTNSTIIYIISSNDTEKKSEFFKSTDGGLTWTQKTNGFYNPTTPLTDRIDKGSRIATTLASPDLVMVVIDGEEKAGDNKFIGVFKSTDKGESWICMRNKYGGPYGTTPTATIPAGDYNLVSSQGNSTSVAQAYYDLDIEISNTDPNLVWVGTTTLNESKDGGKTWSWIGGYKHVSRSTKTHPDIQDIDVVGNIVWVSTDGGLVYSTDNLQNCDIRNNNLTATQYWGFGSGWNVDMLVGGKYHNGNAAHHENYTSGDFVQLGGGETPTGYVNPGNEKMTYFSDIGGKIIPPTLPGTVTNLKFTMDPNEGGTGNRSDLIFDPRYSSYFYMGFENKLWKTTDNGTNFTAVYKFGTDSTDKILGIQISRSNPDVLYAVQIGINTIWKTKDAGVTWAKLTLPVTGKNFMDIHLSPTDENQLWLVYGKGNNGQKVYKTLDGGATWINLTTAKLDGQSGDICSLLQYGTDGGLYFISGTQVFYRNNTMADWDVYSQGLPTFLKPRTVRPFYRDNKIRLATVGKSIWESPMYEKTKAVAQPMTLKRNYAVNEVINFDCYSALIHNGAKWEWTFPGAAKTNGTSSRTPTASYCADGTYDVTLKITDADGNISTKTVVGMIVIGSGIPTCASAPVSVTASSITMTAATVTWPPVCNAISYVLEYKLATAATYTNQITIVGTSTNLTGLTPGKKYDVRVKATCAATLSSPWTSGQFTTPLTMDIFTSTSSNLKIEIFPNPVKNDQDLTIVNHSNTRARAKIFDEIGRLVDDFFVASGTNSYKISDKSAGTYHCQIIGSDAGIDFIYNLSFIIQ